MPLSDEEIREVRRLSVVVARLEEQIKAMREDIAELNSWKDMVLRIVVSAVIVALLGTVIVQKVVS